MGIVDESQAGNLDGVRRALDDGADVNTLDSGHDTALTWASYKGYTEIVRLLLDHEADITITNRGGSTPLQLAKGYGHTEAAKLIEMAALQPSENWNRMGRATVAHVGVYPDIDQTITTIFNFKSRDRIVIAKSISANNQSVGPATGFDALPRAAVEEAVEQFARLGGKPDRDYVFTGTSAMDKPKLKSPQA